MQAQHAAAVLAAALVASTSALDAAYAPAKLQWQAKARDTTVLLLTETEGAKQTAQAMWPVGAAIEALLNDFEDAQNVICCLPFATGKDCATFGLRRYERGEAWALGSAANVGSCRAAAEALEKNRDGGAFSLRCAELAVDADVDNGVLSLAGFASEAASKPENVEAVANALGLAEGQVAYAAATPGDTLVVEVEDETALAAAAVTDGAWPRVLATTSVKEGFAARCLTGDDALTAAVTTLGLYWTARSKLDVGPPLRLSIDGEALSLTLSPPPKPKLGGRKRRMLPRLPSVAVSFI
jgi:hypothetical protein